MLPSLPLAGRSGKAEACLHLLPHPSAPSLDLLTKLKQGFQEWLEGQDPECKHFSSLSLLHIFCCHIGQSKQRGQPQSEHGRGPKVWMKGGMRKLELPQEVKCKTGN